VCVERGREGEGKREKVCVGVKFFPEFNSFVSDIIDAF
jgi:hypothetical protein